MTEVLGTAFPAVDAQPESAPTEHLGVRKNGKQWKQPKKAFRLKAGASKSWEARLEDRKALAAMKAREKEMKAEKEDERQRRIQHLKQKREAKEEKERYAKLAEKMHAKRVERLKRREKRNKALKER
ncbi:rRNA-processing protein cgr1 [Rhizina undulata]